jgi:hypothetical protein
MKLDIILTKLRVLSIQPKKNYDCLNNKTLYDVDGVIKYLKQTRNKF